MIVHNESLTLPSYPQVLDVLLPLDLPVSASELHGLICGYLCAGASAAGEQYLRGLLGGFDKSQSKEAMLCLFELFALSQQQLQSGDFAFRMLLPEDFESLALRAQAFCDWCEGFTQGMVLSGRDINAIPDEDSQEALHHIREFAQLDQDSLQSCETDEKALMEVSEYTRLAVLQLYHDWQASEAGGTTARH